MPITLNQNILKYKKILIVLSSALLVLATALVFMFFTQKSIKDNDKDYKKALKENYRIFAMPIPEKLDFCGEEVPINRFDVRESLDKELLTNTYWQSQTMMMIKRANRWFPVIEPILKKNNIPDDFKYLALAESNFTLTVSPAGAAGFWQFMKETGTSFGLIINEEVDERYNLEKATDAACKYLKDSYISTKSWTNAAASYNMGKGGVLKNMQTQKVSSYYDLLLNTETSRYVFRILSLKLILQNPRDYGFYLRKLDMYPSIPTYTVPVDSSITDMVGFAKKYNLNYKLLKEFNPWLRKNILTNKEKRIYNITLPKEGNIFYDQLLKSVLVETFILNDSVK